MSQTPMTKFMCKNCDYFLRLALLNESIVDDNMLLPWHAKEVSIAMSTSLTSINYVELGKRELQSFSKAFNTSLQVSRLERRELVEKR